MTEYEYQIVLFGAYYSNSLNSVQIFQVVSATNILELPAISRNKAGRYVCEATNSLGTTQSEETLIDVKCESLNMGYETYFNPLEYIFRRSNCYIS